MPFTDEDCVLCGRAAPVNAAGEGHGLVTVADDEAVGRVCDDCADEKLDGVPDAEGCVVCGADADYAHVGLTTERTAEGDVPVVEREGETTPVLCGDHFEEFA